MMTPEQIKQFIEAGLASATAYVEGDGSHFTAAVICPAFAGKTRVQKQQMVYDTVKTQLLDGSLHALSLTTLTPEEWQALADDLRSENH
jgi:acid stress-induced BolA-like protein IbaG/YrbA